MFLFCLMFTVVQLSLIYNQPKFIVETMIIVVLNQKNNSKDARCDYNFLLLYRVPPEQGTVVNLLAGISLLYVINFPLTPSVQ